MNQLVPLSAPMLPALVTAAGERAGVRFLEFFAANIRNPHTRRAYSRAVGEFLAWCEAAGVPSIAAVQPLHVATWIEISDATGRARRADREAAPRGAPPPVRLARRRPGRAGQSGRLRARPVAYRQIRQDAGARSGRGARAARQHRRDDAGGPARPRADRADGLFLRAHRRGARDEGRGRVHAEPPAVGAAARERRQAPRDAVPPQSRGVPGRLSRRRGPARRSQGAAVPHHRPRHRRSSRARRCRRPTPTR